MHRHIIRWSAILTIAGIILTAILIGIARVLLPGVEHYRAEFASALTQTLHRPVSIGSLRFEWQGWAPILRADDVAVLAPTANADEDGADFRVATVYVRVAPWASLLSGAIQPARVFVQGVELPIHRHADGHVSIAGIDLAGGDSQALPFLEPTEIRIADSTVWWRDDILRPDKPSLHFEHANLLLGLRRTGGWYGQLDARLGEGHIDLRVAGDGDLNPAALSGRAYLRVTGLPLPRLAAEAGVEPGLGDLRARLDSELWADIDANRLERIRGTFAAQDIRSRNIPRLTALDARFDARRTDDGWGAHIADLHLDAGAPPRLETGVSIAWHQRDDGDWLGIGVDTVHLERWHALFADSPLLPEAARTALSGLAPRGSLRGIVAAIGLPSADEAAPAFHIEADVSGVGTEPWSGVPGITGLSAHLRADASGAVIELDSRDVVARFPGLFRTPLKANRLAGQLAAIRDDRGWRLHSERLILDNDDISTETRVEIDVPDAGQAGMKLISFFHDGDASTVPTYLPAGIMPDDAVAWLDRGIVSGHVRNGNVLFNGRFGDFPFDDHSGHFEVRFNGADVVVDYKEGWPRIEELEAEARFVNRRMEIHGVGGKILGASLNNTSVLIPDLLHSNLHINGSGHGEGAELLRFLMETPLHDDFGVYFKGMNLAGDTGLDLSLYFPLADEGDIKADGNIRFAGNSLAVDDLGARFEDLDGTLNFTGGGLYAKGVTATLRGRPVTVNVATDPKGLVTQVDLATHASLTELGGDATATLARQFPGRTDWHIGLGFQRLQAGDRNPDTEIVVRSDLRGIAIDAPAPFGKTAGETRALRVSSLVGVDEPAPVRIRYGELADLLIDMRRGKQGPEPRAAELRLGGAPAAVPQADGLRIRGSLPEFTLGGLAGAGGAGALPDGLRPRDVELHVDRLIVADQTLHDADLRARHNPDGWQIDLASREAKGEILIPEAMLQEDAEAIRRATLLVQLDHLRLQRPEDSGQTPTDTGDRIDPRTLPNLRLGIAELRVDDMNIGRVDVEANTVPDGLELRSIRFDNGSTKGSGDGDWRADADGQLTNLELVTTSDDLGETLRDFGFIDVIDGGRGQVKLLGGWIGAPTDFSMKTFDGNLHVRFSEGRLLEVNPGAGGRLFGLFSLTALPRRLRLDFTDLFKKGFSFDVIEGSFNLIEGVAYTLDLTLRGPPAQVDITGDTDFIKRTYNQTVTVTPRLGTTVAAASALLNPLVGAAVLVANKLLQNPIDKASRFQYEMLGPWDDPTINRLGGAGQADQDSDGEDDATGGVFLE
ncbi:MAG: TIGR02099 family protein [Gammaproteobacteria bacterium]|nr:TIGR02099 family protein [Gammaproteobacteria bacterium]